MQQTHSTNHEEVEENSTFSPSSQSNASQLSNESNSSGNSQCSENSESILKNAQQPLLKITRSKTRRQLPKESLDFSIANSELLDITSNINTDKANRRGEESGSPEDYNPSSFFASSSPSLPLKQAQVSINQDIVLHETQISAGFVSTIEEDNIVDIFLGA